MTNQEKKEYLNRYRNLDRQINRKLEEKELWMTRATHITPSYSFAPGGDGSDKVQSCIDKIIKLEEEINTEIDRLISLKKHIEFSISQLDDEVMRLLLWYRYIDSKTWEQIAVDLSYNYRWVLRLHGRALDKLAIESHIDPMLLLG